MFLLKTVTLAEVPSGDLRDITGTIDELDFYLSVGSESLRGDARKIIGNYYQLFLVADRDLSFPLGYVHEL